jgi:hypothetical protein
LLFIWGHHTGIPARVLSCGPQVAPANGSQNGMNGAKTGLNGRNGLNFIARTDPKLIA